MSVYDCKLAHVPAFKLDWLVCWKGLAMHTAGLQPTVLAAKGKLFMA